MVNPDDKVNEEQIVLNTRKIAPGALYKEGSVRQLRALSNSPEANFLKTEYPEDRYI